MKTAEGVRPGRSVARVATWMASSHPCRPLHAREVQINRDVVGGGKDEMQNIEMRLR